MIEAFTNRLAVLKETSKWQSKYKKVFETPEGEEILLHLMEKSGLVNPKIVTDPNLLMIQQGQQRIVLSILKLIGKDARFIQEQIKITQQIIQDHENQQ